MVQGILIQLASFGAQDVFLVGNPEITYFKTVYRRYTNFAIESILQRFNGLANFGKRVTSTISRNGDLITKIYVRTIIPSVFPTSNFQGELAEFEVIIDDYGNTDPPFNTIPNGITQVNVIDSGSGYLLPPNLNISVVDITLLIA